MHDENAPSTLLRAVVAVGLLLAAVGTMWWIWLIATDNDQATSLASRERETEPAALPRSSVTTEPTPMPALTNPVARDPITISEPVLFDDDMGTASTEFSAVALNEETNRLMVADDEGWLFEFDLADDGVPITPPRRTIISDVDDSDIEGIAWISGNTYVLAHEATGRLSVVEIDDGTTVIDESSVRRTINTQIPQVDGNGIEGVSQVETIDDVEFIVVVERPPSLNFIDDDGALARSVPLRLGVEDVADVWGFIGFPVG